MPHQQAGHMTCTRPQAERQIPLATRASSTHDPIATFARIAIPSDPLYKSRLGWIAGMVQERPDQVERRLSAILGRRRGWLLAVDAP